MGICGRVTEIISDGYERRLKIKTDDGNNKHLWCYFIDTEAYVTSSSDGGSISIGQDVCFQMTIQWVNDFTLCKGRSASYAQPILNSSHITAIGTVKEIIDDYSIKCDIGMKNLIIVQFEMPISALSSGDEICFSGNLVVDLIE